MKKLYFVLIPFLGFANSNYEGTYICNEKQQVTITANSLYIGNGEFIYQQTNKNSDIFMNKNKNDVAYFFKSPSGDYTLNIWDINEIINKTMKNPYVGRCLKVN